MAFENVDYKSLDIPAAPFSDPSIIPDFPKNKVPRHIGVIMDGNGRWAQQRGLIRTDGHQAAEPVVFDTIAGAIEAGVRYLSLYTFSTENWKRSPQEVRFLMGFSRDIIHRRVEQMNAWGVRVRWSGRRPKLWKSVIDELGKSTGTYQKQHDHRRGVLPELRRTCRNRGCLRGNRKGSA